MDHNEARTRLLDAAETLFYERGIQAVGMDEIRAAAAVSLKRLYQCFPSKDNLVEAYLYHRDRRWRAALADHVTRHAPGPADRPLAVFDWLGIWFAEPDFRGCAFLNSLGELGAVSPAVTEAVRHHKHAVRNYLTELVRDLPGHNPTLADQLLILMDGAITVAAATGDPTAARHARTAAATLLHTAQEPIPAVGGIKGPRT